MESPSPSSSPPSSPLSSLTLSSPLSQEQQESEKDSVKSEKSEKSEKSDTSHVSEKRHKMECIGEEIQKRIANEAMTAATATTMTAATASLSSLPLVKSRSFDRSFDHRSYTSVSMHKRIADSDTLSNRSKRFLTDYTERLEELIWVHSKSAEYYERRHNCITIPSIILTSASAVVSLLASSSSASPAFHYSSAVSVGVIAAVSSVFQALSSTLKFGTKAELHREVADRYNKIVTTIKFEIIDNHTEDNFMADLEKQVLDVQNYCKYLPPMFFYDLYRKIPQSA
jgi:hypothetical protein